MPIFAKWLLKVLARILNSNKTQQRKIKNFAVQLRRSVANFSEIVKGVGMFPNKYAQVGRELVKAVYVEAPDKSSGKRKQKVHIEYDLVGYIPVDELIKAEQA